MIDDFINVGRIDVYFKYLVVLQVFFLDLDVVRIGDDVRDEVFQGVGQYDQVLVFLLLLFLVVDLEVLLVVVFLDFLVMVLCGVLLVLVRVVLNRLFLLGCLGCGLILDGEVLLVNFC